MDVPMSANKAFLQRGDKVTNKKRGFNYSSDMAAAVQWMIPPSSPADQNICRTTFPSSSRPNQKPFHPTAFISTTKRSHHHQAAASATMALGKKKSKPRLVTISTSDGRWHSSWSCDYTFSLQELQLLDHDVPRDTVVHINLCIEKHAGLGLSVEGKVTTCFTRKCCHCCTPYNREINATFKVWILPSTRPIRDYSSNQLLDIDVDDPSVIFVKPGYEVNLDFLIQDTVRLATSVEETCSESCEKSEPKLHHLGARNVASVERRWHKLLELKKKHDFTNT